MMDLHTKLESTLDEIGRVVDASEDRGTVASYIPELASVDPLQFALTVVLANGQVYEIGDSATLFSTQSVSKVFTLALVLAREGETIWRRVGREPSGQAFDSILLLEYNKGRPKNPFVNAGAIVTTDNLLVGRDPKACLTEILQFVRYLAEDDDIHIDEKVALSEEKTGYRNIALANYILSHGNLQNPVDQALNVYFNQCALAMTTRQLAMAGRFLAFDGRQGTDQSRVIRSSRARRINALMMTCGHYDGSGDFAYRVGIPGKSGVGGGILAVVPNVASIAVWSPGLNSWGNSSLGTVALEILTQEMNWSVFK